MQKKVCKLFIFQGFCVELIQIRPFFYDIRKHDHLKDIKVDYPEIENSGIMLPSYPGLKDEQQEYIINCLHEYLKLLFEI